MVLKGTISATKPFKRPQIQMAIYWNFSMVYADRSNGVHNHAYINDMLVAGINYFNTLQVIPFLLYNRRKGFRTS